MKKIVLEIDGMTCSACSNGLEKYLNKQKGIISAKVNLVMATASIEYDEKILNREKLDEFILNAGFKSLGVFKEIKENEKNKNENIIFIIFSILIILIMYLSMENMLHLPMLNIVNMHVNPINYVFLLFILTLPFLFYGRDIFKNGYKNLIHKTPNMDTLVSIGVISSLIYSIYNIILVIRGNYQNVDNLYLESVATIIYFIKLGRIIDKNSKDKAKNAISKLTKITPNAAIIKTEFGEKSVTIDEVLKGDILISKPGEKIAVDGVVTYGKAHFDESFLTGESMPVSKEVGSKVLAGSINYDGYVEYKAERIGKESTISEIVKLVVNASNSKMPSAKIADKVSSIFVRAVILIAFITFIIYLIIGLNFKEGINAFITILVVACPCSLGLATPLALVISEGKSASKGIIIKKGEILENARKIDTIVFDKTGTLTQGKLNISVVKNYSDMDDKELIRIASSVEKKSMHPISKAFTNYAEENNIEFFKVSNFENIDGMGIKAIVEDKEVLIGNSKLLIEHGIKNNYKKDEEEIASKGNSVVYVALSGKIVGIIGVSDSIRKGIKEVIESINKNKMDVVMITGDNKILAEKVGKELEIKEIYSEVFPNDKAEILKKIKANGKNILMVGDGINDAPALSLADIGVSINNASDIAIDSADVILTRNDLYGIIDLIEISKKTVRNVKQNLFWAFFYNILMIPIASGIFKYIGITINPMIASVSMVLSSIAVILNALRLNIDKK